MRHTDVDASRMGSVLQCDGIMPPASVNTDAGSDSYIYVRVDREAATGTGGKMQGGAESRTDGGESVGNDWAVPESVSEFDPFRLISGTVFVGDQGGVSKPATGKPGRTSRFSGFLSRVRAAAGCGP